MAAKPPTRPSLARTAPSLARAVLKPFYRTSAADLLPPACKARSAGCEKWVSEVMKVNPFLVFIFPETYIYYISCIYLYCYMGEKVHNNYLMGLIFSTSWMVAPKKNKILWGYDFFKKLFKSNRFQVIVWSQKFRFSYFSFGLIFKRIPSQHNKIG